MRAGAWWSVVGFMVFGCEQGYKASPTYCDDYCQVLVRPCQGAYDPAACVVGCEDQRRKSQLPCVEESQVLIDCVRSAPGGETYCFTGYDNGNDRVCAAAQEAWELCRIGGEEGRMWSNCFSYCYDPCADGSAEPDASLPCDADCVARGLGSVHCDAEREALQQCRDESIYSCFTGEATTPLACEREDAALQACGAQALGAAGAAIDL